MDETKIDMATTEPEVIVRPPKPKVLLHEPDKELTVKTCCGPTTTCDKPLMTFLARFLTSTSVLSFCFIQLSKNPAQNAAYLSATISLILGTYLSDGSSSPPARKDSK